MTHHDSPRHTRREWLARLARMGLHSPLWSLVLGAGAEGCASDIGQRYWDFEVDFEGRLLVIGAGASGLAAAYLLDRYSADFEVLEASSVYGGRVKRGPDLFDFPFDLGAEWIHEDPSVLAALIDDPATQGSIDTLPYSPDTVHVFADGELRRVNAGGQFYSEYKFSTTTWYGFLETYIAPGLEDRIRFDTPVVEIDTSGARVAVRDASGTVHEADRVLVTVPLKILQTGDLRFTPALPQAKRAAIDSVTVPGGIKVFIEFSERFYPDLTIVGGVLESASFERLYYDAAFRKPSERNVLGLFCVGDHAPEYTEFQTDAELIAFILDELDAAFDGRASASYLRHVAQNWSREPYIQGAYSHAFTGDEATTKATLAAAIDDKLFFSGEALSVDNGSTVPGAMETAYAAVEAMLTRS